MKRLLVCWLALALTGCAAVLVGAGAGAGVGVYSYLKGNLVVYYQAPCSQVAQAAREAVHDLGFTLEEEKGDALEAKIKAKTAEGTPVWIWMNATPQNTTKVKIRVGYLGNLSKSVLIMRAIEKRLGVAPAKEGKIEK